MLNEIWHYPKSMTYDGVNTDSGLFSAYISKWMTKKIQASGYPKDRITRVQKHNFIDSYKERENITLRDSEMEYNPSMRATAKLVSA
jgi:hypothetical protein